MRKYYLLFLLVLFGVANASNQQVQWRNYSKLPAARSNPVVVSYNNKIYVAGGNNMQGATNSFWSFNPKTHRWQELPNMLHARFAHGGVVLHDRLYIFGGMSAPKQYLNSVEYFNFKTRVWHRAAHMPYSNARFAVVKYQKQILLLGGINQDHAAMKKIISFHPKTHSWHSFGKLPVAFNRMSAVNMHGHLHVLGGANMHGTAQAGVWEYLAHKGVWVKRHSLQNARQNFALVQYKKHLLLTGGWRKENGRTVYVASTEQFTRHKTTSKIVGYMPQGRDGVRMVALHGKVYLIGGYNKVISDKVQILTEFRSPAQRLIKTVNHACIVVPDMQRTIKFYHDVLGFNIIKDKYENNAVISKELGLSQVKLRNVFVRAPGGFELQIIQFYNPQEKMSQNNSMTTVGYNHIGVEVNDIQKMYKYLSARNVKIIAAPIIKSSSGYAIFFAEDPDGNRIEFFQKLG